MHKYQREKAKRMKKMRSLGISIYGQRKIVRDFKGDFDEIDKFILQWESLQKSGILNKIMNKFKEILFKWGESFGKKSKGDNGESPGNK